MVVYQHQVGTCINFVVELALQTPEILLADATPEAQHTLIEHSNITVMMY